jgi:hypothetical protein
MEEVEVRTLDGNVVRIAISAGTIIADLKLKASQADRSLSNCRLYCKVRWESCHLHSHCTDMALTRHVIPPPIRRECLWRTAGASCLRSTWDPPTF